MLWANDQGGDSKMQNKKYEAPEAQIVCHSAVDVITASLPIFNDSDVLKDGWIEA